MKEFVVKIGMIIGALLSFLCVSAYDFQVDGIYYSKLEDGYSVAVSNKSNSTYATSTYGGEMVIPATVSYKGLTYDVVGISDFAFYNSTVVSVSLPESITSIGHHAFAKSKLIEECDIPSNVSYLGNSAFEGCEKLSAVVLPTKITQLQLGTFFGCKSITSITIPKNVMRIIYSSATWVSSGSGALNMSQGWPCFANCTSLKDVISEDGDRPIDFVDSWNGTAPTNALYANQIFYNCPIETVHIGRNFNNSNKSVFEGFNNLSDVTFGSCVSSIADYAFRNCTKLTSVNIPDYITSIGSSAFSGCSGLTDCFIGNGVDILPYGLFSYCNNLKTIYIGNKLEKIKQDVFYKCNNLQQVIICSDGLNEFSASTTPSNVTFFLPSKNKVLDSYTCELIATIIGGKYEYSGKCPPLDISSSLKKLLFNVETSSEGYNAGNHNLPITVNISFENIWSSNFSTIASYSITPAPLTVIPENVSRQFGCHNPELTCSFFGFKNNETVDVLTRMPNVETTATTNSPVGTYPIIATGAEAQNYSFNYERGTLTVTKANQEIEWKQSFGTVNVGDVVELTAKSTSGLPIKYTVTDESIAEIYSEGGKKYVEFLKPGTLSIRANQEGNENYNEADRVSKQVSVSSSGSSLITEIILSETKLNINEGESFQFHVIISPVNAANSKLSWISSNPEIASVDESGVVTGIKQGTATVTVKSTDGSNVSASCEIIVVKPVSDIYMESSELTMKKGDTATLKAYVLPQDATNRSLLWTSSDEIIVTVSDGVITAINYGKARVTVKSAEDPSISKVCEVTVSNSTGIADTSSDTNLGVRIENNTIFIMGKSESSKVSVYNTNGAMIYETNDDVIEHLVPGLYIINIDNMIFKVIV